MSDKPTSSTPGAPGAPSAPAPGDKAKSEPASTQMAGQTGTPSDKESEKSSTKQKS